MTDSIQLFRVELQSVEGDPLATRIMLNGRQAGPVVTAESGPVVLDWFLGYLEERVQQAAERVGVPEGGSVVRAEHVVPEGDCPKCGKEPFGLPIVGIIENPCPVCRR